jgi:hypothetical protein
MLALSSEILIQGVYTAAVNIIGLLTVNTCGILVTLYNNPNQEIVRKLKSFDIEQKIRLIRSVLYTKNIKLDINKNISDTMLGKKTYKMDPLDICINSLIQSIQNVHTDLINIQKEIESHNNKWFYKLRMINLDPLYDSLQTNMNILDKRFSDFLIITI